MMVPALTLEHVGVTLASRAVVRDVTVTVGRGSATVVVGRSGAGKSVLWKAAAGLLPRSSGRVVIHTPPLVFVHQDPALLDDRDVLDNVLLPATVAAGAPRVTLEQAAWQLLQRLGLGAAARTRPSRLSPSQARRAALARALLLRPGVLIVDEPTTGLDPGSAADVDAALVDLVAPDRAVVVVTHHPRTLATLRALPGARVIVVEDGRLRPDDTTAAGVQA
jgi:ABC-type transporter Mla maintaining outer membrane lipid asymmetry ATPase subunit MlaF